MRKAHFVRGKRCVESPCSYFCHTNDIPYSYSILPALSLEGMIHCHIVEGSFDTAAFTHFIETLLDTMQPFPAPNSVIVMDNCRIHKDPLLLDMITSRYVRFNPIGHELHR